MTQLMASHCPCTVVDRSLNSLPDVDTCRGSNSLPFFKTYSTLLIPTSDSTALMSYVKTNVGIRRVCFFKWGGGQMF